MPQIPQPEVSDSDFGAFEAAAVQFADSKHRANWEPTCRCSHTESGSIYVSSDTSGVVRVSTVSKGGMLSAVTQFYSPAEAAALASELLAAACAARNAARSQ